MLFISEVKVYGAYLDSFCLIAWVFINGGCLRLIIPPPYIPSTGDLYINCIFKYVYNIYIYNLVIKPLSQSQKSSMQQINGYVSAVEKPSPSSCTYIVMLLRCIITITT